MNDDRVDDFKPLRIPSELPALVSYEDFELFSDEVILYLGEIYAKVCELQEAQKAPKELLDETST